MEKSILNVRKDEQIAFLKFNGIIEDFRDIIEMPDGSKKVAFCYERTPKLKECLDLLEDDGAIQNFIRTLKEVRNDMYLVRKDYESKR